MIGPLLLALLLPSCASQKAFIDRTAANRIFWPGEPERPRIAYLLSISTVSGKGSGVSEVVAGADTDLTDPATSSRLLRPYSLFLDEQGKLLVADPGAFRVSIIDLETGDVGNIRKAGDEEFLSPVGIAAFQGRIFVSDSVLKKVLILDREGRRVGEVQGPFERPTSLALDRIRGILYVSDTLAHRIHVCTIDGKRVRQIGKNGSGEGEFNFPTHLWVDGEGRLYVTDSLNFRVQIFSPDGSFEGMFGTLGDAYGNLDKPKGVATDSEGNIYVVDSVKDMVKIFNIRGELLLFFGQEGREYGEFWLPSGIFIDSQDKIYIADSYNGRVQVFQHLKGK